MIEDTTNNVIPDGEITLTGDGTHPLNPGVPDGTEYDFVVKEHPENQHCTFGDNASGAIDGNQIELELICVPSKFCSFPKLVLCGVLFFKKLLVGICGKQTK